MAFRDRAEIESDGRRLRNAFVAALSFVLLLWAVKGIEFLGDFDLVRLGVYPRRADGLPGVLLAPLIHGSFAHLFANTAPLLVMGTMLLYGYPRSARALLPAVYLGSGFAVWLFAREAYHIGASGLAFGLLSFMFTVGVLRRSRRDIAISLAVVFLYGGMISGIVPGEPGVSFESHLGGAVLGVLLAFALRDRDPPPPRKPYSWEDEEAEPDDFDWPDEWR